MKNQLIAAFIGCAVLLASHSSSADQTFVSETRFADDSDNNTLFEQGFQVWTPHTSFIDVGIQYQYRSFKQTDTDSIMLLGDARLNPIGVSFAAGYDSHLHEPVGHGTLSYWYSYGSLELTYEKDLVDSQLGLQDKISFEHTYLTKEFNYHDQFILVGRIGQTEYSDNVRNDWWALTGIYPMNDNFNLIAQRESDEFNKWSPYYFSPQDYSRTLVGVGTYHQLGQFEFLSRLLYGTQNVESNRETSYYARFNISRPVEFLNASVGVEAIFDQKEPDYRYDQLTVNFQKSF